MKWEAIYGLSVETEASKEVHQQSTSLNDSIAALLVDRQYLDNDVAAFSETDPILADPAFLDEAATFGRRRFDLLRREFTLRERLIGLADVYLVQVREMYDRAIAAFMEAEAKLRKQLVSIGYKDCPPGEAQECIRPQMIFVHPSIRAAAERKGYLFDLINSLPQTSRGHREAANRVAEQMKQMRDKLAASVV